MDLNVNTVGNSPSLTGLVGELEALPKIVHSNLEPEPKALSQIEKTYSLDRSRKAFYITSAVCAASIFFAPALPLAVIAAVWAQHTIVVLTICGKMYFARNEVQKKVQEQWELFLERNQGQVDDDKILGMKREWKIHSEREGSLNFEFPASSIVLLAATSTMLRLSAAPFAFLTILGILGSSLWLGFHVLFLHRDIKGFENYVNVENSRLDILSRINQVLTEKIQESASPDSDLDNFFQVLTEENTERTAPDNFLYLFPNYPDLSQSTQIITSLS